jgi:cysteine synthase B
MNKNILGLIGNTPLVEINKLHKNKDIKIFAKAEWTNLSGSVKDRAALSMIENGEKSGKLTKDKTLIESTSGNTGIALAAIAKIKGYKIKLVMPENASEERKKLLKELGAELILTDSFESIDGAYEEANKIYDQNPAQYFKVDQYSNPANPKAHYNGTALEIWKETKGKITHFVAGTGTSGTIMGTGKRFKELKKDIKVVAVEPKEEIHGVEGLKNMRVEMVPAIYEEAIPDEKIYIPTEEAYNTVVRLAKEEHLLAGQSSGLNIAAALMIADTIKRGMIVTVLPDSGYRYLSKNLFPDDIFDIEIKMEDLEKIHQHVKESYPYEACGLLVGDIKENKKIVKKVFSTENKNKVRANDRYEIDPREYIEIEKTLEKNESVIGIFHSHPDHPSRPSETDLTRAHPVYSYIIVSTVGSAVISTTAWTLDEEEKSFREEFLNIK